MRSERHFAGTISRKSFINASLSAKKPRGTPVGVEDGSTRFNTARHSSHDQLGESMAPPASADAVNAQRRRMEMLEDDIRLVARCSTCRLVCLGWNGTEVTAVGVINGGLSPANSFMFAYCAR